MNLRPASTPPPPGTAPPSKTSSPQLGCPPAHLVEILGDLYTVREPLRRLDPEYKNKSQGLVDLTIVMPITAPYGQIVVDTPLGENYYEFGPCLPGAQLLFGRPAKGTGSNSNHLVHAETAIVDRSGPVCDVWASFLRVKLGVVYNVQTYEFTEVCRIFRETMANSDCEFFVPIVMDCRGIYEVNGTGRDDTGTTLETRGRLLSENDKRRFRMIRRHVKKFARELMLRFPLAKGGTKSSAARMCVELDSNFRSSSLDGGIRVCIRQWNTTTPDVRRSLSDFDMACSLRQRRRFFSEALKGEEASPLWSVESPKTLTPSFPRLLSSDIKNGSDATVAASDCSARVMLSEIRLEHQRFRMVDPRWPDEMVVGRRIADSGGFLPNLARFVFCSQIARPVVIYRLRKPLRTSTLRMRSIFGNHVLRHPEATPAAKLMLEWKCGGRARGNSQDEVNEIVVSPIQKVRNQSWDLCGTTRAGSSSFELSSPLAHVNSLDSPIVSPLAIPLPLPQCESCNIREPCRYFLSGGCARGDSCRFFHAADPKLQCLMDLREARDSQHPKFF